MFWLEFKGEEPMRRVAMLQAVFSSAFITAGFSERTKMILGFHPEWTEVSPGDYQIFVAAINEIAQAIIAGDHRTVWQLADMIWETYRPRLAARVGVDTGELQEDILTAGIRVEQG